MAQAQPRQRIRSSPARPRREQADFLNACDVGVVALCRGMYGVSVPSRTYNIMAAGRPVLAIVEPRSEIARMVEEEGAGWVVPPGDAEQLAQTILALAGDRQALRRAGQRARHAAETTYSPASRAGGVPGAAAPRARSHPLLMCQASSFGSHTYVCFPGVWAQPRIGATA